MRQLLQSPVVRLVLAFIILIIAGAGSIILFLLEPQARPPADYIRVGDQAYQFESLRFSNDEITLSARSGYLVPLLRSKTLEGIIIIANGEYKLKPFMLAQELAKVAAHSYIEDKFNVALLSLDENTIDDIIYSSRAELSNSREPLAQANQILSSKFPYEAIAPAALKPPSVTQLRAGFWGGDGYGAAYYFKGTRETLILEELKLQIASGPVDNTSHDSTSAAWLPLPLMRFTFALLLVCSLIYILTLQWEQAVPQNPLPHQAQRPKFMLLLVGFNIAASAASAYLSSGYLKAAVFAALVCASLLLLRFSNATGAKGKLWFRSFKVRSASTANASFLDPLLVGAFALLVVLFGLSSLTYSLPTRLSPYVQENISVILTLVLISSLQTVYYHSALQRLGDATWGKGAGAALVMIASVGAHLVYLLVSGQHFNPILLRNGTVSALTLALLSSYFYSRSHSALGCAVIRAGYNVLPLLVSF